MIETGEYLTGDDEQMSEGYKAYTWGDGIILIAQTLQIAQELRSNSNWIEYPPSIGRSNFPNVFISHNIFEQIEKQGLPKSILKFIFGTNLTNKK